MFPTAEKPLTAGISDKLYQVQKTFFFEKEDGSVIAVDEPGAWNIISGKQQTINSRISFKLIGVSDGKSFQKALIEAKDIFYKEGLQKSQERIRQGFQEELEAARGHIEKPRNFDAFGRGGEPVRIDQLR